MLPIEKNNDIVQQILHLKKNIRSLPETQALMSDYLLQAQAIYIQQSKSSKSDIQNFQQIIISKSFYSIGKCQAMKELAKVIKKFCLYVENLSKNNKLTIDKINSHFKRQEAKLQAKAEAFINEVSQYRSNQIQYNKQFGEYQVQCTQLDEQMLKFKSYEDPIKFYNLHMASQFSKKLDKKYHHCEHLQVALITHLQVLDEKRKHLSSNLRDIKDECVLLLHYHLQHFQKITKCLVDTSKEAKEELLEESRTNKRLGSVDGDLFEEEIKRFNSKYGERVDEEELLDGLKQLFRNGNQSVYIGSDYKLFLDRCETFRDKKCESVEQALYLQKKMLTEVERQIQNFNKIDREFIKMERQIFKNYGMTNFKKRINKYFGNHINTLMDLCETVVENPRRRFEKIGKLMGSNKQKLKKIIQAKDQELKKFKKRIGMILEEHSSERQGISGYSATNIAKANQFKTNVQKSFTHFNNIVQEFSRNQKQLDEAFNQEILKMVNFSKTQFEHCLLGYLLSKEKQKYNLGILKNLNIDTEIISIVADPRYEVLFSDPLSPCLFDEFKSLINKKNYEDTKKVLQKKQYQERNIVGQKVHICCGMMESRKVSKTKILSQHKGKLQQSDDSKRDGIIQVMQRGITFQEKNFNPFSQKVEIMIPFKEIISFNEVKRTKNMDSGVEILTNMGKITFLTETSKELEKSLDSTFSARLSSREPDRKDRNSQSSSFLRNSSSSQFKVSYDSVLGEPKRTSKLRKADDSLIVKEMIQKWKSKQILSQFFKPVKATSSDQRQDYRFEDDINKFLLKERRSCKVSGAMNFLFFDYEWKISFPQMPMLKSFRHSQTVRMEIQPNLLKIIIIEKPREQEYLFVRNKFYKEVEKMNKMLTDLLVEFCEREAEVIIQMQKTEEESSILFNIDSVDKDESISKNQARLSRAMSNTQGDKNQPRLSRAFSLVQVQRNQ